MMMKYIFANKVLMIIYLVLCGNYMQFLGYKIYQKKGQAIYLPGKGCKTCGLGIL